VSQLIGPVISAADALTDPKAEMDQPAAAAPARGLAVPAVATVAALVAGRWPVQP
jgi:hypothetical protein